MTKWMKNEEEATCPVCRSNPGPHEKYIHPDPEEEEDSDDEDEIVSTCPCKSLSPQIETHF
jgi:hypothetical protein